MLKQLSVNISLVEALEQIPSYAKFMDDLMKQKWNMIFEHAYNLHHYSLITSHSLIKKKKDVGVFSIPCTTRALNFSMVLCELGANINLMFQAVFR